MVHGMQLVNNNKQGRRKGGGLLHCIYLYRYPDKYRYTHHFMCHVLLCLILILVLELHPWSLTQRAHPRRVFTNYWAWF